MLLATKIRLYPTEEQKQVLERAFGNCRWLWNYFLDLTNKTYKETGKGLSRYDLQKLIPELKREHEWLATTYSQCLQSVCLNMSRAFINFFEKRAEYPSFKSKFGKQSLQYPQNVKITDDNYLKVPKIGKLLAVIHRPIEGKIKTVTISKNTAEQYFASILVDEGKDKRKPSRDKACLVSTEGKAVGIDLGLTHFAITSDGEKIDNPRWLEKHQLNLKRKQQQLSRKRKGSSNRNKARRKLAKAHLKVSRSREDFQHKLSRRIVDENQVIIVENLNIKGMVKNHCLSKSISQVGWGQFLTMLKYKAEQASKVYLEVDRFFASSKICNNCLYKMPCMDLSIRRWTCPHCGTKYDRDINASKNIRDEGLRILTSGTGGKAYRPTASTRGRKKSTVQAVVG